MLLLSGHAATWELGRGGFQELSQAAMAAPVTKASWMVRATAVLAEDVARAIDISRSGRPGPVHLSLPSDVLDEVVSANHIAWPEAQRRVGVALPEIVADAVLTALRLAARPVILAGPHFSSRQGHTLLSELEQATGVPTVVLESPRGVADATIGAFSDIMRRADLVMLLGKALDFTVRWLQPPVADKSARVIVLDPDGGLVARAAGEMGERLLVSAVADSMLAGQTLIVRARLGEPRPKD
jgi:acetolactate synthase-1/2/3 large subunit